MNSFERALSVPIPLADAADFFIRIKSAGKKEKASEGMMGGLPPTGMGKNMAAPMPMSLPPTAMGQNKVGSSEKSPHELGKERAHTALSSEFEREKHHSHERRGDLGGRILGGAAGLAATRGKSSLARLGAAALGQHVGGHVGRAGGASKDRKAWEAKHASALKLALEQAGIEPQLPPGTAEFLASEQAAEQQAEMQEAAYLRQQLEALRAQDQAAQQELQQLQQQQSMTDQQIAQYQAQVANSTQQAMSAQDQVLQQQQAAAAMRMAYQQLRGQLLQAASTDPPSLSGNDAALAAASTAAQPNSTPSPTTGPAGQAPNPGTPGTVAPEGDDTVSRPIAGNEPMFGNAESATYAGTKEPQGDAKTPNKEVLSSVKLSSLMEHLPGVLGAVKARAPYVLGGAALGAAGSALSGHLSSDPEKQAPGHVLRGALEGAAIGGLAGPAAMNAAKNIPGRVSNITRDLKAVLMKGEG